MWNVQKARLVFDMMVEREVTSWNSMLSGYTQNGQATEALLFFFYEMRDSDWEPNPVTALIMVSALVLIWVLSILEENPMISGYDMHERGKEVSFQ